MRQSIFTQTVTISERGWDKVWVYVNAKTPHWRKYPYPVKNGKTLTEVLMHKVMKSKERINQNLARNLFK